MNIRNINVRISANNGASYASNDIIEIGIQRSITDGSFGIGFTQSDRLSFSAVAGGKLPRKMLVAVYTQINDEGEKRLGKFYVDSCTRDGSVINVVAYDAMYYQGKSYVKFGGNASIGLEPLSFPCTMQAMLDYICTLRNFTCNFQCQPFQVSKLPQKSDGSYFTVRELLGFIASSHGCNAHINNNGDLVFRSFSESDTVITASDATEFNLDDSEPYTVEGLYFTLDDQPSIYIDDSEEREYDEDNTKIVRCYNPLATIEIANYAWSQIVEGREFYSGSVTMRGTGENECGDIITVGNLKYPSDAEKYRICITDISYTISADRGFIETLSSQIIKESGLRDTTSPAGGSSSPTGDTLKMYILPDEPGKNAASGDFWAVQPSDAVVDELYIYDTDWQPVKFEYKEGSPPSDPTEGLYWALIGAGALRSIFQYTGGTWVDVSLNKNLFKNKKGPPTDGAVWIKTNNTTDNVAEAMYEYTSIDGWIEQFVFGGAVSLGNGLEYDANGRLQAKLGEGLEFDSNGAIKLSIQPVVNIEYGLVYGSSSV